MSAADLLVRKPRPVHDPVYGDFFVMPMSLHQLMLMRGLSEELQLAALVCFSICDQHGTMTYAQDRRGLEKFAKTVDAMKLLQLALIVAEAQGMAESAESIRQEIAADPLFGLPTPSP